jgi:hypothetical protein
MPQADNVVKVYPDTHKRLTEVQQTMTDTGRPSPTFDTVINTLLDSYVRWLALAAEAGES